MANQLSSLDEIQARLIQRAWADQDFKKLLLEDPRNAIGEELGVELPGDLEIQVVEETENKICLVLPIRPEPVAEPELSDEELEAVAGGVYTPTRVSKSSMCGGFGKLTQITVTMPGFRGR